MQLKIEHNRNISLHVHLQFGGRFAQPALPCAIFDFQQPDLTHGPPPAFARRGLERILCAFAMALDTEKYKHHLDSFDLTEAQKTELIHTVAAIMESFVDQGFGVHPVQLCLAAREKADSEAVTDQLESEDNNLNERFGRVSADSRDARSD